MRMSLLQLAIYMLRAMRPRQWAKNAIIYAGIVFDGQLFNPESFLRVTASFFLLCMISGAIYIINDLVDVESDRQHPKKRFRMIASGKLPSRVAQVEALVLIVISLVVGTSFSIGLGAILVAYLVLHLLYSWRVKHIVILDLMAVAAGFVLRVAAGVVVVHVQAFSPWLYACTALLALFIIIGKRRQELLELGDDAGAIRSTLGSYNLPLLDDMLRMVMTSTIIAYLLYVIEAPSALLAGTKLGLLTVPFVLYALWRYLYLIHVEGEGSAPEEVLFRDRPLQISILLWGLTFVAILYLPHA